MNGALIYGALDQLEMPCCGWFDLGIESQISPDVLKIAHHRPKAREGARAHASKEEELVFAILNYLYLLLNNCT